MSEALQLYHPSIRRELVQTRGLRFDVAMAGEGDRLALCLHGFPECWISWRHQLPLLARLGYRVWAPDLRGYGDSDRPHAVSDYALECLLQDVADLIDASGAKSTFLLGHDWGGLIAWLFATRRTRELERLCVMNLPHPGAAAAGGGTWAQLRKSWYVFFFQLPCLPEALLGAGRARAVARMFVRTSTHPERFPPELTDVYRASASRPGAARAMVNYYRALLRGGMQRQRALGFPVIDTPTLMLWGEDDLALTKELTYGTDAFVSDLTLRYLPGISHWVQQDAPDEVNEMLAAWLAGEPVPGALA